MAKTIKQLEEELKKANASNARLKSDLKTAKTAAPAPAMGVVPIGILPRFIDGLKVNAKTYFSTHLNLHITKTYRDPLTNKAAWDFDQIHFVGFFFTTDNELRQKCIESQGKYGRSIWLVTDNNRSQFAKLAEKKIAKVQMFKGPATSATSKGELARA